MRISGYRMQNVGDIFGQVFRAIWANKLRSFLTMFAGWCGAWAPCCC